MNELFPQHRELAMDLISNVEFTLDYTFSTKDIIWQALSTPQGAGVDTTDRRRGIRMMVVMGELLLKFALLEDVDGSPEVGLGSKSFQLRVPSFWYLPTATTVDFGISAIGSYIRQKILN